MLLNEKFDEFSNKLVSIEEKFDTTAREIYIKMEQIEKEAEDAKADLHQYQRRSCLVILMESIPRKMKQQKKLIKK